MHLYSISNEVNIAFRDGTRIEKGTVLGVSGKTGRSTGVHLHFGIIASTFDVAKFIGGGYYVPDYMPPLKYFNYLDNPIVFTDAVVGGEKASAKNEFLVDVNNYKTIIKQKIMTESKDIDKIKYIVTSEEEPNNKIVDAEYKYPTISTEL